MKKNAHILVHKASSLLLSILMLLSNMAPAVAYAIEDKAKYSEDEYFEYELRREGYKIKKLKDKSKYFLEENDFTLTIPESHNDIPVIGLGKNSLQNEKIKKLNLPNTIKEIDDFAIYKDEKGDGLEEINIYSEQRDEETGEVIKQKINIERIGEKAIENQDLKDLPFNVRILEESSLKNNNFTRLDLSDTEVIRKDSLTQEDELNLIVNKNSVIADNAFDEDVKINYVEKDFPEPEEEEVSDYIELRRNMMIGNEDDKDLSQEGNFVEPEELNKKEEESSEDEAYAAQGQIIDFGEGRSMEVLEEPEVKFLSRTTREHSPMKFRLKGFKEGDKFYLADLTEYTYLDDGFSKKKGDKDLGGYSLFPVPEYSIIDSNHGINIAKHPYSHYGPIIFNKNVEKYETVDISLDGRNYWYFDPFSFEDSPYNKSEPIESFYMARLVTNETKNSDWIEFKKNVFDVSEINLPKRNRHGFMNGIYPTLTEEDSTEKDTDYLMNIGVTSYLGGSIKKGQYFSYEIFVPKGMKFKNDKKIDKDFISKSINNTVRQGFSRDYDKGITSRGLLSSDRKTFKDFSEVGLDYKYNVREEDGYDVHKYTFTNINGYIDNYTLIKGIGDFPFIVELEDLDLSNPTKVVINNPKKIIKFKTTKKFTNKNGKEEIAEKTSLLDSVSIPQGSVDAFGVLRLDFTKPISKLQVTPLNKQPEDITEFLTNYTGVSGIESVEYKDGKKPDVSKAIEKMPVDLVITYDDGRKEDFKSLLTVTPIEEPAKFNTKYQADSKLKFKEEKVVQEGKEGLQRNSGPENIEVLEPAVDKIISVGNVEKIEESIPHEEKRILDKNLTPGTEKVVQEGKDGVKTITKTYTVDPAKGLIADNPKADEKVTPAEDRIIHYMEEIQPPPTGLYNMDNKHIVVLVISLGLSTYMLIGKKQKREGVL